MVLKGRQWESAKLGRQKDGYQRQGREVSKGKKERVTDQPAASLPQPRDKRPKWSTSATRKCFRPPLRSRRLGSLYLQVKGIARRELINNAHVFRMIHK